MPLFTAKKTKFFSRKEILPPAVQNTVLNFKAQKKSLDKAH